MFYDAYEWLTSMCDMLIWDVLICSTSVVYKDGAV